MMTTLLKWDLYEVRTKTTSINGVMFRGRIRKLCLEKNQNVLVENTQDIEESVRFAVLEGDTVCEISEYVFSIAPDATIEKVLNGVENPILSKLKVNIAKRYTL